MGGLFDMDKPFWRWIGKLPELAGLSLCWFICCIPLVTFIPASCALYDAASRNLVADQNGCFKRFFRTFVRELKQGIFISLLWLVIFAIAIIGLLLMHQNMEVNPVFTYLGPIYLVMTVMMLGYLGWLIPLQSRYQHSFSSLHINALRFAIGRLWGSLGMILITIGVIALCFLHTMTLPLIVLAPCLIAVLHTIPVERGFRKAFPEHYEDENTDPAE